MVTAAQKREIVAISRFLTDHIGGFLRHADPRPAVESTVAPRAELACPNQQSPDGVQTALTSSMLELVEALMNLHDGRIGSADTLQRAVDTYVDDLRSRATPPERVLAIVKELTAEFAPLHGQLPLRCGPDSVGSQIAQWAIKRYFCAPVSGPPE